LAVALSVAAEREQRPCRRVPGAGSVAEQSILTYWSIV
jgi:hypothetical protein